VGEGGEIVKLSEGKALVGMEEEGRESGERVKEWRNKKVLWGKEKCQIPRKSFENK